MKKVINFIIKKIFNGKFVDEIKHRETEWLIKYDCTQI